MILEIKQSYSKIFYYRGDFVPESVYKIIELVGSSEKSWQDAIENVIKEASKTLRDLRIAEVVQMDVKIDNNQIALYRVRVKLSFKYEGK